ncbi:DUF159-domain-containing protein [Metschnikowia bicuspidata var. bicuspidata NRRL YB-4993]|uniref:DUF159-domain-containing protein n=1 Tax=Metschnikowia bicuspidata var. bicuspidata NRRL YB-4993 TaxID=869754 RepID=A0A1A0HCC2_9ASCO|nr:DUF159-domain-containing protein [Metschnikowia bicuspidata var. bicuspidata NRRL YB-4993]OBA21646.1 DUF159-domain-containing protein [Metschnikowia bicuspidata var. bicuspidata NRRL YB-4993]
MCGRYALGISIENLPQQFNENVLHPDQSTDLTEQTDHEIAPNSLLEKRYETTASVSGTECTIHLNVLSSGFQASYNIPPTATGAIIYMDKHNSQNNEQENIIYCMEPLKFGLLPVWAKPQNSQSVKKGTGKTHGTEYSREVQQHQAKLFNCRRETLAQAQTVWATPRKHSRCVVPILGYFEWLNTEQGKVPYFVHLPTSPLLFLAGLYSHNHNYNDTEMVPLGAKHFSSFSIVTGPASGKGKNDMLWLHSRKPIFIEPNSKAWFDWLRPDDVWDEQILQSCLNTDTNPVYESLRWHTVAKSVGNPKNKCLDVIEEENVKQRPISSFFQTKKEAKPEPKSEGIAKCDDTGESSLTRKRKLDSDEEKTKKMKKE